MEWCCVCQCSGEAVDHLLVHCKVAYQLWSSALRSFCVSWVLPERVVDLLFGWCNWLGEHSSGIRNLVPLCMMWTIWREWNKRWCHYAWCGQCGHSLSLSPMQVAQSNTYLLFIKTLCLSIAFPWRGRGATGVQMLVAGQSSTSFLHACARYHCPSNRTNVTIKFSAFHF